MTLEERSNLVLAFARVLHVNGQATEESVAAAARVGDTLGLHAKLMPRWGELQLQSEDTDGRLVAQVAADPTGVDMDRVAFAMRTIEELRAGRLAPDAAMEAISAIAQAPPASTWLFTLAAAAGAVALAVLFGIQHLPAAALIFVSAAAGALLRRALAQYSSNVFVQPFCAALLAGVIGGLAERYQLSSSLRLVAVCPCMILVPGPHVLNGALDLINGRVHIGAARLIYAGLVIVAISAGLLLGLATLGVSLPVDPGGRAVPLWQDILAAGVAVASYSVFFSTPLHMLIWPVAVGMLAHALRWAALSLLGSSAAIGAFLACLVVGLVLTPVARRWHMPFAAIRLRLRGIDDAGRLPFQDGQRPGAACGRFADDAGAHSGNSRRRHDRRHHHSGNEPWPRGSEFGDQSLQREIGTGKIIGGVGHADIQYEFRPDPSLAPPTD